MARKKMRKVARRAGAVVRRAGSAAARAVRRGGRRAASGVAGGLKARKSELVGMAAGAGAAYGIASMQIARSKEGKDMPTVAGIMPALTYGVAAAVLGTVIPVTSKGMAGAAMCGVATGQLAIAAAAIAAGAKVRVKSDESVAGEIVGDDSDEE